ncbi:MAG TPA: beta-propeller fold lactonase family protein [Polyangia bacterium]|jgi:6-phosphogluconolactonase (cycloisomerase 2 family)
MARRGLFVSLGWSLVGLVAFAGCGNGHGQPMDMTVGGSDLADGSSGPTVSGTVTGLAASPVVLQNNGGDDLTVNASGAFIFTTPLADGDSYDVSILTQPSSPPQICTVSNGKGTIVGGASVSSVAVRCAPVVRFVLVADKSDGSVGTFALDAPSGRLRYAGKSAAGMQPVSIATDPDGRFAYVANAGDGTVSQYGIDENGQLQALAPATVTVGAGLAAVIVDPAGHHAYAVGTSGVAQFSFAADGKLTPLSPATVSAGAGPYAIAVEPSGRFAYVANATDWTVSQFSVAADGTLTALPGPTAVTGAAPTGIAVDPTGRFVYVTGGGDSTVSQYSIGSDGTLTPATPATVAAGTGATSPVVDPTGKYLFVANPGDKTVSQYSIGSDGTLTPAATATAAAGTGAAAVIVDGSGKFAWVANPGDDTVAEYSVGTGGLLAANLPATLPGQQAPTAFALVGGSGPAQPTAAHAYVSDSTGSVRDFPVGANGVLGTPATIATTGFAPETIVLDAAGTHAYVLDDPPAGTGGNVLQYAVSSTGAWSALSPANVGGVDAPIGMALHPSGRFAYVANSGPGALTDTVSQFSVGADGKLTALATATVDTGSPPQAIAVDPTGRFAYVATNSVLQYSIGSDGTLTMQTTAIVPGGAAPSSVAVDPTGHFVYVADSGTNAVLQYASDATDGHLTALTPASAPAGTTPVSVALDPFGRYAYAIDDAACTVSQYALGATGPLTALTPASVGAGSCVAPMDSVVFLAVDPSGRFLYVPDQGASSGTVLQYGLGTGGALAPLNPAATTAVSGARYVRIAFWLRYQ